MRPRREIPPHYVRPRRECPDKEKDLGKSPFWNKIRSLAIYPHQMLQLLALIIVIPTAYSIFIDLKDRQSQRIAQAWGLITQHAPGNSGKIQALQYLNSVSKYRWPHKQRQPLTGIDLSKESHGSAVYLPCIVLNNAELTNANLSGADLRGAIFAGADLQNTNFSEADLRGADFSKSNLVGANFSGAELENTNFSESKLARSDFSKAQLSFANFSKVEDLSNSDFKQANLHKVNMSGAYLGEVNFSEANLGSAVLAKAGVPPALPGRPSKFDFCGSPSEHSKL